MAFWLEAIRTEISQDEWQELRVLMWYGRGDWFLCVSLATFHKMYNCLFAINDIYIPGGRKKTSRTFAWCYTTD